MIDVVKFIPYRELSSLKPNNQTAVIYIHDAGGRVPPNLDYSDWGFWDAIGIDDAAYSKEQIKEYGENFNHYFDGCALKYHALKLLLMIKQIRELPINELIIISQAGRSRSAAVAKYYSETYNVPLESEPEYANSLIYSLLIDPDLFEADFKKYKNKSEDVVPEDVGRLPKTFLGRMRGVFNLFRSG